MTTSALEQSYGSYISGLGHSTPVEFADPNRNDPWRSGNKRIVDVVCRDYLGIGNFHPEIVDSAYNALAYIYAAFSRNLNPLYLYQQAEGMTADPAGPVYNPIIYLENNIGKIGSPPRVDLIASPGFDFVGFRGKFLDYLRNRYQARGLHNFSIPDEDKLRRIFSNNGVVCTDDLSNLFRRFSCFTPEYDDFKVSRQFGATRRMDGQLILTWNKEGKPPFLAIDFAVPNSPEEIRVEGMVKRKSLFNITIHSASHTYKGQAFSQDMVITQDPDVSALELLAPLSRIALENGNHPFSAVCSTINPETQRPVIIAAPNGNGGNALTDRHAEMLVLRGHEGLVTGASIFGATEPCPACALNLRQVNPENLIFLLRQAKGWNGTPVLRRRDLNRGAGLPVVVSIAAGFNDLRRQMLEIFEEANRTHFANQFDRLIRINSIQKSDF